MKLTMGQHSHIRLHLDRLKHRLEDYEKDGIEEYLDSYLENKTAGEAYVFGMKTGLGAGIYEITKVLRLLEEWQEEDS